MSLMQDQIQTSIYICNVQCFIRQANIAMKFPCSYFVEWRTINSKNVTKTQRHNPHQNQVTFQEKINMQVQMLFDHSKLQFLKRETIVELYLISKSRPDQNKLVGRVNIDLGKVINVGMYQEPTEFKLNFCSIEGTLIMQFKALEQRLTSLTIQDLDKSSFIDFISQATLKNQNRNQSMIISRHDNHSAEKREPQRVGRSQIRGISPGSPKASSISKSNILSKAISKNQPEKRGTMLERGIIGELTKSLNDSSQARKNINTSNTNINAEPIFQTSKQHSIVQSKKSERRRRPLEIVVPNQPHQEQIVSSPTMNLHNILKTSSHQMFENNANENILQDEIKLSNNKIVESRSHQIAIQQFANELKIKKEHSIQIQEQNDKLRHQIIDLQNQKELIYQQKSRIESEIVESRSKIQAIQLQADKYSQQIDRKNKIIENYSSQLTEKQTLITNLQQDIKKINQSGQKSCSQCSSSKLKMHKIQCQILELKQRMQSQQVLYEQKIIRYEQFIKSLQKEHQNYTQKISLYEISQHSLKIRLEELQIQNNQLVSNFQNAKRELETKVADAGLKQSTNLQKHQQQRNELQKELEKLQGQLQDALQRYDSTQKDLAQIQGKYFELQMLYDEQASANEQLKQQLEDMDKKYQHQHQEVVEEIVLNTSQVLQTCNQVQQDNHLEKLRQQNESLSNQIQFLKSNMEETEKQYKSTLELIHNQNQSFKQEIISLQAKLAQSKSVQRKMEELIMANRELTSDNQLLKEEVSHLGKVLYENDTNNLVRVLQEQNEDLREQARSVEAQVEFYEKELLVLKDEIVRIRQSRQSKPTTAKVAEHEQAISRLSADLEQQINQNNQLSEAIVRYMEKQTKMKETLTVLERQSKEIFSLVQEKEQNQETYQKAIEDLQIQLLAIKNQQEPSPTRPNNTYGQIQQEQKKILQENGGLLASIKQLKQASSKLNDELMHLSIEYNEVKNRLQAEVSNLTDSLINAEADAKREEQIHATKLKEYERTIKNKDIQMQIWKSRSKERQANYHGLEAELANLKSTLEEIQQEKFNLQSTNNEKDIKIIQLQEEIAAMVSIPTEIATAKTESNAPSPFLAQIGILSELKEKLLPKNLNPDWDSLLQSILDRSMNGEDTSKLLNLEEKSRLLSKELQKMKAQLLKSDWRNQQQKIAAMDLFKKCESIVSQLITAAESLNQNQSSFL